MTEHIRGIVAGFLKELKKKKNNKDELFDLIQDVIDPKTKKHIKGISLKKNQMVFYVDSSVWGYQLNLLKPNILKRLREQKDCCITNIFIKVQSR